MSCCCVSEVTVVVATSAVIVGTPASRIDGFELSAFELPLGRDISVKQWHTVELVFSVSPKKESSVSGLGVRDDVWIDVYS